MLFVRNINFETPPGQIRSLFEQHGEIKTFFDLSQKRGLVFITYFDIRAAEQAKAMLHGMQITGRPLDIHFSLPREEEQNQHCDREKNQGTLFIILKQSKVPLEDDSLRHFLSQWGEVKHIRPFKDNPFARFVEYYDTRATGAAYDQLPDTEFQGSKWDVKFAWDFVERRPPPAPQGRPPFGGGGGDPPYGGGGGDFRPPYERDQRERSPVRNGGGYGGGGRRRFDDRPPYGGGGPGGPPPKGRDDYGRPPPPMPPGRDYGAPAGASPVAPAAGSFGQPTDDAGAAERLQQAQKVQALLAALGRSGGSSTPLTNDTPAAPSNPAAPATSNGASAAPPSSGSSAALPASVLALLKPGTDGAGPAGGTAASQAPGGSSTLTSAPPGASGPPSNILAMLGQNGAK